MDISKDIIDIFEKRIRYNKILKKIEIFNEYKEKEPSVNDRIQNLFHKIDLLGNYSDHKWFTDLNATKNIDLYMNWLKYGLIEHNYRVK